MSDAPRTHRLAGETSPYLRQHATNPVDWYPWGPEALARARELDRPILLSIGYAACHWCHVMEAESFANERVAALVNEHVVAIKVDREERPDLDALYMRAVQAMTGSGGWPLTVFLTPDLEPILGGTYFPPYRASGLPGFTDLVASVARAWGGDREAVVRRARDHAARLARDAAADRREALGPDVLERAAAMLDERHDDVHGGFGDAPKFPRPTDVRLCLRLGQRAEGRDRRLSARATELAVRTLHAMADGGLRDQLGGGFHRYCVDERWLVPHFEMMLADNALLATTYLEGFLATGEERFARVAREALEWALRELRLDDGGFATSLDADDAGGEGGHYTWTPDELTAVLGPARSALAQEAFGIDDAGHTDDGRGVLHRPEPLADLARRLRRDPEALEAELAAVTADLRAARARRPRPARDDKLLTGWNALLVSALALGHQVLGEPRYLAEARRAARVLVHDLRDGEGRLLASRCAGRPGPRADLADHAYLQQALLDLYESDFDVDHLRHALALEEDLERHFRDAERGGCFQTPDDHEPLPARLAPFEDEAQPSGNGVHALNLLRLAEWTGTARLAQRAEATLRAVGQSLNRFPVAFSQLLLAADFLAAGPREVVLAGEPGTEPLEALLAAVRGTFRPQRVVALARPGADEPLLPLLEGRTAPPGGARAYPCRHWACGEPLDEPLALAAWLLEA